MVERIQPALTPYTILSRLLPHGLAHSLLPEIPFYPYSSLIFQSKDFLNHM